MANKETIDTHIAPIDLEGLQKFIIYYPDPEMQKKLVEKAFQEFSERETNSKDFMSLKETAAYLGCSPNTLKSYINLMDLPTIDLGGRRYISKETLKKWMLDHEQ